MSLILGIYTHHTLLHIAGMTSFKDNPAVIVDSQTHSVSPKEMEINLYPLVDMFFKKYADSLKCIALQTGPSSFTSLRITLAFIQGLAIARNFFLYPVDHFSLLKHAHDIEDGLIIIDHSGIEPQAQYCRQGRLDPPIFPYKDDLKVERIIKPTADMNYATHLCTMAQENQSHWINPYDFVPTYGILPTYKKTFQERSSLMETK